MVVASSSLSTALSLSLMHPVLTYSVLLIPSSHSSLPPCFDFFLTSMSSMFPPRLRFLAPVSPFFLVFSSSSCSRVMHLLVL